jgi:hypothetical protein
MMNSKLVVWVKGQQSRGFSDKQIRSSLLQHGYTTNAADAALNYARPAKTMSSFNQDFTTSPNLNPTFKPQGTNPEPKQGIKNSISIKNRNPFLVLLFTLITIGIYGMYWVVSTTNELRRNTKSAPNPWLLLLVIVPLVNLVVMIMYYWKYSKAINELSGFSAGILFLLWVVFSPAAIILSQLELNKMAG